MTAHDIPVDLVATPRAVIEVDGAHRRPRGSSGTTSSRRRSTRSRCSSGLATWASCSGRAARRRPSCRARPRPPPGGSPAPGHSVTTAVGPGAPPRAPWKATSPALRRCGLQRSQSRRQAAREWSPSMNTRSSGALQLRATDSELPMCQWSSGPPRRLAARPTRALTALASAAPRIATLCERVHEMQVRPLRQGGHQHERGGALVHPDQDRARRPAAMRCNSADSAAEWVVRGGTRPVRSASRRSPGLRRRRSGALSRRPRGSATLSRSDRARGRARRGARSSPAPRSLRRSPRARRSRGGRWWPRGSPRRGPA